MRGGMLLRKVFDGDGQQAGRKRGRVTDTQAHIASGGADTFQHLVRAFKKVAGFAKQGFTDGGEANGMGLAFQQALTDLFFQGLNLPAQCGLREKYFLRRAADVGFFSHGHKVTQLSKFHSLEV